MKTISIRLESEFAKILSEVIKNNMYSTKTEFIREAIREKIKQIQREETIKRVEKLYGSSKRRTTDEDLHKAREKAFEQLEKKHGLR